MLVQLRIVMDQPPPRTCDQLIEVLDVLITGVLRGAVKDRRTRGKVGWRT
jgi:hypothetical protein